MHSHETITRLALEKGLVQESLFFYDPISGNKINTAVFISKVRHLTEQKEIEEAVELCITDLRNKKS
ncbi:MAG: hypothetical protein KJ571_05700 [Bacteroidetes bacterium]|nr:hypothetical protein [Bacteroidota bacterium]